MLSCEGVDCSCTKHTTFNRSALKESQSTIVLDSFTGLFYRSLRYIVPKTEYKRFSSSNITREYTDLFLHFWSLSWLQGQNSGFYQQIKSWTVLPNNSPCMIRQTVVSRMVFAYHLFLLILIFCLLAHMMGACVYFVDSILCYRSVHHIKVIIFDRNSVLIGIGKRTYVRVLLY